MKCEHGRKYRDDYIQCMVDGTVRKCDCVKSCHKFKPTFWGKLMYRLTYGRKWEG